MTNDTKHSGLLSEQMIANHDTDNAETSLLLAEEFIKKYYLNQIGTFDVNPIPRSLREATLDKTTRLFKE